MTDLHAIAGPPLHDVDGAPAFEPSEFYGSVVIDGEQYDYAAFPAADAGGDVYWTISFGTGDFRYPHVEFPPVPTPDVAEQLIRAYFMGREHGGAR